MQRTQDATILKAITLKAITLTAIILQAMHSSRTNSCIEPAALTPQLVAWIVWRHARQHDCLIWLLDFTCEPPYPSEAISFEREPLPVQTPQ
jgi:hypothetical protein